MDWDLFLTIMCLCVDFYVEEDLVALTKEKLRVSDPFLITFSLSLLE